MSSSPSDFEKLQKLLAMKRHEQPPPRFFANFSDQVLDRIHLPEPVQPATWWQKMGLDFDLKPAFVCAWGVALCASLVVAIIASLHLTNQDEVATLASAELAPLRVGVPEAPSRYAPVAGSLESPLGQFSLVMQPTGLGLGLSPSGF